MIGKHYNYFDADIKASYMLNCCGDFMFDWLHIQEI